MTSLSLLVLLPLYDLTQSRFFCLSLKVKFQFFFFILFFFYFPNLSFLIPNYLLSSLHVSLSNRLSIIVLLYFIFPIIVLYCVYFILRFLFLIFFFFYFPDLSFLVSNYLLSSIHFPFPRYFSIIKSFVFYCWHYCYLLCSFIYLMCPIWIFWDLASSYPIFSFLKILSFLIILYHSQVIVKRFLCCYYFDCCFILKVLFIY